MPPFKCDKQSSREVGLAPGTCHECVPRAAGGKCWQGGRRGFWLRLFGCVRPGVTRTWRWPSNRSRNP